MKDQKPGEKALVTWASHRGLHIGCVVGPLPLGCPVKAQLLPEPFQAPPGRFLVD